MPHRVDRHRVERLAADQFGHGVGQLDFAARSRLQRVEQVHDLGLEDVAADHAEARRGVGGGGFFDQAAHLGAIAARLARGDDAVARGPLGGD